MFPEAILITEPIVDFDSFLTACHSALGYSPAESSDSSRRQQSNSDRFLSCLAALHDRYAPTGLTPNLLSHVSFSILLACDERDLVEVMECASGVHFVAADSVARGVMLAVASGTLQQWRDAVVTGTRREGTVRLLYNRIISQFESRGLNVWNDFDKRFTQNTYYLEQK
jgi:hypothetical protein